jgi:hypothetical protein
LALDSFATCLTKLRSNSVILNEVKDLLLLKSLPTNAEIENKEVSIYSCSMLLKKTKAVRLTQEVKAAG